MFPPALLAIPVCHLTVVHNHLMLKLNVLQCLVLFETWSHFETLAGLKPAILGVHKIHQVNENIIKPRWRSSYLILKDEKDRKSDMIGLLVNTYSSNSGKEKNY